MYKKLQSLREGKRENHTLDAPSPTLCELDPGIYMVQSSALANKAKIALLDNASTYTVLQDHAHFEFKTRNEPWPTCDLSHNRRETKLQVPRGAGSCDSARGSPLICERAIYAPDSPRSLISYHDLRANDIHVSTAVENDEEVLELRRGPRRLTTAHAAANGLYELCFVQASPPCKGEEEAGEHRHECHPRLPLQVLET